MIGNYHSWFFYEIQYIGLKSETHSKEYSQKELIAQKRKRAVQYASIAKEKKKGNMMQ